MEIAVIGLPNSGKTTVFNALTRGSAQVAAFASVQGGPNVGVAKVPDGRLDQLSEMSQSKQTIHTQVEVVDIGGLVEVVTYSFMAAKQADLFGGVVDGAFARAAPDGDCGDGPCRSGVHR